MNPNILAGLLKNFYSSFSMEKFDSRLKLQKIVYLMQAYGLNIGYTFHLYLYGPYSTELARDGFSMPDFLGQSLIQFSNNQNQAKFEKFIRFIEDKKDDTEWLEIAASLHLLKNIGYTPQKAIDFIKGKRNDLYKNKEARIKSILEELKAEDVV